MIRLGTVLVLAALPALYGAAELFSISVHARVLTAEEAPAVVRASDAALRQALKRADKQEGAELLAPPPTAPERLPVPPERMPAERPRHKPEPVPETPPRVAPPPMPAPEQHLDAREMPAEPTRLRHGDAPGTAPGLGKGALTPRERLRERSPVTPGPRGIAPHQGQAPLAPGKATHALPPDSGQRAPRSGREKHEGPGVGAGERAPEAGGRSRHDHD